MSSGSDDPVLFLEEVAAEVRLSKQTLRRHIREHRLVATKRGNRWFVRRSAVEAFKGRSQVPAAS
jgi:excisionase family DNA binding protein